MKRFEPRLVAVDDQRCRRRRVAGRRPAIDARGRRLPPRRRWSRSGSRTRPATGARRAALRHHLAAVDDPDLVAEQLDVVEQMPRDRGRSRRARRAPRGSGVASRACRPGRDRSSARRARRARGARPGPGRCRVAASCRGCSRRRRGPRPSRAPRRRGAGRHRLSWRTRETRVDVEVLAAREMRIERRDLDERPQALRGVQAVAHEIELVQARSSPPRGGRGPPGCGSSSSCRRRSGRGTRRSVPRCDRDVDARRAHARRRSACQTLDDKEGIGHARPPAVAPTSRDPARRSRSPCRPSCP